VERGIGRHVVRFVELAGGYYALKELPQRLALREYRLLGELDRQGVPAVEVVGVVTDRADDLPAVLITRQLEFALPYRLILGRRMLPASESSIRAALAELLVRIHLVGLFWGDCSLSNALFRRDAGALSAYLVDVETGELHDRLSDGQREHDLAIAEENLVGELYDLAAELTERRSEPGVAEPEEFAAVVRGCYEELWSELTADQVFAPGEGQRLEERLRRLNELGFDVEEVELLSDGGEVRLRLHSKVVEPGHHRRRLLHLTGLDAQENQARRLLNDLTRYKAYLERTGKAQVSDAAAAGRWLSEIFEPTIAAVPPELRAKRAPAEIFHEILEHRWFLSEAAGRDVGLQKATDSYLEQVLRMAQDERLTLTE
jgi:tRNA A-37 threonylcarbamoyl transferase component Bud32